MLVLAIGGFWPQYFSAIVGRTPQATTQFWLIHLHAALFTTWLLIYISQATLIMTGYARVHLKLGPWFAAYGFIIALVGVYAAGALARRLGVRKHSFEEAAAFVFFPSSTWFLCRLPSRCGRASKTACPPQTRNPTCNLFDSRGGFGPAGR